MKKKIAKKGSRGTLSLLLCLGVACSALSVAHIDAEAVDHKVDANSSIALRIAEEGTVLLKNEGMLPLRPSDRVVGLGVAQDVSQVFGGGGSGWVNATGTVNYRAGMETAVLNGYLASYHAIGSPEGGSDADKALYFISRDTTEGADRSEDSFELSAVEKQDITGLIRAVGKENVGVVLNVGSVVDTSWLISQDVGAIVVAYLGGEQAGNALANVLTGAVSPSGKTVDTWAKSYRDYPSSGAVGNFAQDKNTLYTEDVFVGYRYFDTFDPAYEKVNYEFGYGLSYTDFSITDKAVKIEGDTLIFTATVKNTGKAVGKEVVQAYVSAPQGKWGNPAHELIGFCKTNSLGPGREEKVEFTAQLSDFADYDDLGKVKKDSWVLPAGEYSFYLGNSVRNAAESAALPTKLTLAEDRVLSTTNALPETTLPSRLLANGEREILNTADSATNIFCIPAHGSTVIQAESYTTKSAAPTSENYYLGADMGFGMGNLNTSGQEVTYTLDVEEAGEYEMGFAMASAWSGQTNMFSLYVNGTAQPVNVGMNATHTDSDGLWFQCTWLKGGHKVSLPEGRVTLRFVANGTNFQNFDNFVIWRPSVASEGQTVLEAEAFASDTGFEQIADGFATKAANRAGVSYTYEFNVEKAGKYDLSLLASNITAASEDVLKAEVNGTEQPVRISLRRTAAGGDDVFASNLHTFTFTDSVYLDLPQGNVTLKLTTKNAAVCCIDKLLLSPKGDAPAYEGGYRDNTDEFVYRTDTSGTSSGSLITYDDVYLDRDKLDEFVAQLSIEELVQLNGLDGANTTGNTNVGGVGGYKLDKKYGIPDAYAADGPAGIRFERGLKATWFPCMTMLASTWNAELAEEFGEAVGKEAVLGGISVWLAPGVNIHRNPLCGRNFEYYSEDPLIAGRFAGRVTKGAQRSGISVCVKHFAANNQETNRFANNSCVSVRALREIYLKPFEITVKTGDPHAIMSSYNMVNGKHVAATYEMITGVLYEDWGFNGAVFSDWSSSIGHIDMVRSGNTFKSNNPEYGNLVAAYRCGAITREQLEHNAENCLRFLMMTNCGKQNVTAVGVLSATLTREKNRAALSVSDDVTSEGYRVYLPAENRYEFSAAGMAADVRLFVNGEEVSVKDGFALFAAKEGIVELKLSGSQEGIESFTGFTVKRHVHQKGAAVCPVCGEQNPDWTEPSTPSTPSDPSTPSTPSEPEPTPQEPNKGCGGVLPLASAFPVLIWLAFLLRKRK